MLLQTGKRDEDIEDNEIAEIAGTDEEVVKASMFKYSAGGRDALKGVAIGKPISLRNSFENLYSEDADETNGDDDNHDTTTDDDNASTDNRTTVHKKHRPNQRQRRRLKHWHAQDKTEPTEVTHR